MNQRHDPPLSLFFPCARASPTFKFTCFKLPPLDSRFAGALNIYASYTHTLVPYALPSYTLPSHMLRRRHRCTSSVPVTIPFPILLLSPQGMFVARSILYPRLTVGIRRCRIDRLGAHRVDRYRHSLDSESYESRSKVEVRTYAALALCLLHLSSARRPRR